MDIAYKKIKSELKDYLPLCKRLRDATIVLQTRVFSFVIKKR